MYKALCDKCHGAGGYERPCRCFADIHCPECHGEGYWWMVCVKCGGSGMAELKVNEPTELDLLLKE
jgi:DnaJ-class molecular chaperone